MLAILSHGPANYLVEESSTISNAWVGPFSDTGSYWLYWDINTATGLRTFGFTEVSPDFGPTLPSTPDIDQHFFDTSDNYMKVWDGYFWIQRIRVFAGSLISNILRQFGNGSQVDIYGNFITGPIRFVYNSSPVVVELDDGNFFFEIESGDRLQDVGDVDNFILGRLDISAVAAVDIEKNIAVVYDDTGRVIPASYTFIDKEIVGITSESMLAGERKVIITSGFIEDKVNFSFVAPQLYKLYIDGVGRITTDVPPTSSIQSIGHISGVNSMYVKIQPQIIIFGATPTPTLTPASSVTPTVTFTPTPSVTVTVTPSITPAQTVTPTPSPSFVVLTSPLDQYSYSQIRFATSEPSFIRDLTVRADGLKFFIASAGRISAYDLGASFDISTASYNGEFIASEDFAQIHINFDGTEFIGLTISDQIRDGLLSTPWDISTLTFNASAFDPLRNDASGLLLNDFDPFEIFIVGTGTGGGQGRIDRRTLDIEFDALSAGAIDAQSSTITSLTPNSFAAELRFSLDGTAIYYKSDNEEIGKLSLSIPWDVTTLVNGGPEVLDASFEISGGISTFWFKELDEIDGKLWIVDGATKDILLWERLS